MKLPGQIEINSANFRTEGAIHRYIHRQIIVHKTDMPGKQRQQGSF